MENPAEWRRCEKVISDALDEWHKSAGKAGLSKPALVATRLRQHGIVIDGDEKPLGWAALRGPLPPPQAPASEDIEEEEPPFDENHHRCHAPAGPNPACANCRYLNWSQP